MFNNADWHGCDPQTHFSVSLNLNSLTINFNNTALGFDVTPTDEIAITGKFIDL